MVTSPNTNLLGVTGRLPAQQFSPRGQSTTETSDLTTSVSQGSISHVSMPYSQRRERGGGHMRLKPTISAPAKAEGIILYKQVPLLTIKLAVHLVSTNTWLVWAVWYFVPVLEHQQAP